MTTLSAEDGGALRAATHKVLAARSGLASVRTAMESQAGYDPELWMELAELGILGLIIREEHGGSGAGPVELELVMEEVGAALLCGPLLSSAVLAAGLLQALGDADAQLRLLPAIADGSLIATAAITGPAGDWTPEGVAVTAHAAAERWTLDGVADFVTHGQIADVVLVAARGPDGVEIFEVDPGTAGVTVTALPTFDRTLRLARIQLQAVPARRIQATRPAWGAVEETLDLARVALAGEQAGAGHKVLEFTVDYARTRIQFGRPIGSFQAIKHMAADLLIESENAISAARHAAAQLAAAAPNAKAAVNLAAFACADAFMKITADAIQMHGGIAFSWDHPAHLYLRRARADAQLFGAPTVHRERYLQELEAAHG